MKRNSNLVSFAVTENNNTLSKVEEISNAFNKYL